jgi:hypothetical protein
MAYFTYFLFKSLVFSDKNGHNYDDKLRLISQTSKGKNFKKERGTKKSDIFHSVNIGI